MKVHVITEGRSDEVLLRSLLRPDGDDQTVSVSSAGAKSAAQSLATSILVVRRQPVVLVVDADTTKDEIVQEQRDFLAASLGQFARSHMWKVCMAVPEIEAVLFYDAAVISRLFQTELSETQQMQARFEPKQVLLNLMQERGLGRSIADLWPHLTEDDVSLIRESPLIQEIREFIASVSHAGVA
jgi:hypothetical protein